MVNLMEIDRLIDARIKKIVEDEELGMEWADEYAKDPLIEFLSTLCLYRSSRRLETYTRVLAGLTVVLAILTVVSIFKK